MLMHMLCCACKCSLLHRSKPCLCICYAVHASALCCTGASSAYAYAMLCMQVLFVAQEQAVLMHAMLCCACKCSLLHHAHTQPFTTLTLS